MLRTVLLTLVALLNSQITDESDKFRLRLKRSMLREHP